MTQTEFIAELRDFCRVTENGLVKYLKERPPGREPSAASLRRHKWFSDLPARDQQSVEEVVGLAVRTSIFQLLVELDGVSGKSDLNTGMYELRFLKGNEVDVLNDRSAGFLHDEFFEESDPQ